jgi:hypothetical protein
MALPGIMPFESNEGQGAERAKASCCGRHDPTAGHGPTCAQASRRSPSLRDPFRTHTAPGSCLRAARDFHNLSNVVVGELTPLFLDLAGHLLPAALDSVPVHDRALSSWSPCRGLHVGVSMSGTRSAGRGVPLGANSRNQLVQSSGREASHGKRAAANMTTQRAPSLNAARAVR